jgi:hypothetical protein
MHFLHIRVSVLKIILLFVLFFITGCIKSKVIHKNDLQGYYYDDNIFIFEINALGTTNSSKYFEQINKRLSTPCNNILYFPEIEYFFLAKGMDKKMLNNFDFGYDMLKILKEDFQIKLLVKVDIQSYKDDDYYSFYQTKDVAYNNPIEQMHGEFKKVILKFNVLQIMPIVMEREFFVQTTISPLKIREDDGESNLNFMGVETAFILALRKGVKEIKRGLIYESRCF